MTRSLALDPLDARAFRRVLGHYPSGVAVITSVSPEGKPVGMTVTSFTSVSLDPPLVAFFPDRRSSTWVAIRERGAFCVNVLGADQEAVCRQLAAKGGDKFQDVVWTPEALGLPALSNAVAWIGCEIETVHEAGDHYIVVGRVRHLSADQAIVPLLFFQGGYGRFASSSIAAITEADIVEHLRLVEDLRPAMVEASRALGIEVVVTGVAGEELVMLATSGHPDASRLPTAVGTRMPFVPPLGAAVAAFTDPDAWLARGNLGDAAREKLMQGIRGTRERGWSSTVTSAGAAALDRAMREMSLTDPTPEQREAVKQAVETLGTDHELTTIEPGREYPVRSVTVPVLDRADEKARLVLTAYGLPSTSRLEDVERYVTRLRRLAEPVTVPSTVLGG